MSGFSDQLLAAFAVIEASVSVLALGRRHAARQIRERGALKPASSAELQASGVDAWRCCRAVSRAAVVVPWRVRCLPASFALHRVLRWRGVSSAVRLGVRTEDGNLVAHAWVECGELRLDPMSVPEPYVSLPATKPAPNQPTVNRNSR